MTRAIDIYQVDAFADRAFEGNPAAVCPLQAWLPDDVMQAIAAENNLAETAFFVAGDEPWPLRWFTPTMEVELCGHATLASAHVVFRHLEPGRRQVAFSTRSGRLDVQVDDGLLTMDFPLLPAHPCTVPGALGAGLGIEAPLAMQATNGNYLVIVESASEVRHVQPDMATLQTLGRCGVMITAPGDTDGVDFVSRFFAPGCGIPEDPVTGSAHCTLGPYWAGRLGRRRLRARQASARGGTLWLEVGPERIRISGSAVTVLEGRFHLPS